MIGAGNNPVRIATRGAKRRTILNKLALSLAAAAVFAFSAGAASAQTYPERAITIIVPFAAGGPTDTVTRLVAEAMSADLGQQVLVENVGGAGGTVGAAQASSAPSTDGTKRRRRSCVRLC